MWNRVRVLDRGDSIRVSRMDTAEEDRRSAASSRMVSIDRNRHHPARRVEFEDHLCYGELLNLITIDPPYHPKSSNTPPVTLAFAHIKPAVSHKHRIGSHEWSYYKKHQAEEIVDLASVNQLVGRVKSISKPGTTYIIDSGTRYSRVSLA